MHACLFCNVVLQKTNRRGPWPKFCPAHKDGKRPHLSADALSEIARRNASRKWDLPGARERAAEAARRGAATRWRNKTTRSCKCGHVVPFYEGRHRIRCDACKTVACRWKGCDERIHCRKAWCDAHRLQMREIRRDRPGSVCAEAECSRPVRARSVCNMHYKRILQAEGRVASRPRSDKKRDSDQRRRARMAGAPTGGSVFLADILERDGTLCRLCGEPVDMTLVYPNPFSKSVDHVIPLSRGGAHDPSNCQLAHLRCNIQKGAKVAA